MITKVVLKNFKRFKDQDFDLRDHIVFAGPNNSGKSTVIQALAAWHFALRQWLASGHKKRSVGILRKDFSAVPLAEFNQLWTDKLIGYTKSEIESKIQGARTGARRPLEIEIHGEGKDGEWKLGMEFNYTNKDQVYVKPILKPVITEEAKNLDIRQEIPQEARNLDVVHIPSFSGIGVEERVYNHAYQDTLIGQGKPGDILRNLLQDVYWNDKGKKDWESLRKDIKDIFNCELLKPSDKSEASILCQYKNLGADRNAGLDINTAGSGFQQVLLLLALLYARHSHSKTAVILVDEPDAHLHINLQSEVFRLLKDILSERGAQLIIATHSEALINSTEPKKIMSFTGARPHILESAHERSALLKLLRLISNLDFLQAEQAENKILFLEGESDLYILRAWAKILKHPVLELLKDHGHFHNMHGKRPEYALEHFKALTVAWPNLKGWTLVDPNTEPNATYGYSDDNPKIKLGKWKRYEIESYLVHPDVVSRLVHKELSNPDFWQDPQKAKGMLSRIIPRDDFENPLNRSSAHFKAVKASEEILPKVFEAAGLRLDKSEYYRIAEVMRPDEIHGDVIEMLDKIAEHFGLRDA